MIRANLCSAQIKEASVWNVDLEGALQQSLIISAPDEPLLTTDELEVA
ncbi:MAG: hypothetical protein ABFD75_01725 [Smithella sp.]